MTHMPTEDKRHSMRQKINGCSYFKTLLTGLGRRDKRIYARDGKSGPKDRKPSLARKLRLVKRSLRRHSNILLAELWILFLRKCSLVIIVGFVWVWGCFVVLIFFSTSTNHQWIKTETLMHYEQAGNRQTWQNLTLSLILHCIINPNSNTATWVCQAFFFLTLQLWIQFYRNAHFYIHDLMGPS